MSNISITLVNSTFLQKNHDHYTEEEDEKEIICSQGEKRNFFPQGANPFRVYLFAEMTQNYFEELPLNKDKMFHYTAKLLGLKHRWLV